MKRQAVAFATKRLQAEFESLEDGKHAERELYAYVQRAIADLKANPACGVRIPHRLWPKKYAPIDNLWKYDLPNAWRLIYTIKADEVLIVSVILEWFDHKGYERRFKY